MASFDAKDLCRRLLQADSEAEVTKLIESSAIMSEPANWRPLDGRETNFNVTSNQASDGGKALTELMTNMVDAVLMRHAWEQDVDPRSPDAPQTMYDAVDRLVHNLHGGKLTNLGGNDPWLKDFSAKNLVIGVTGARSRKDGLPCYVFVDNGEGQRPDNFHRTFLSLSAGTKSSIPFVQGKYNMGSSGVLGYCGRRWYKLIVSRRFDGASPWGWTLVRRRPGGANDMPVAEYLSIADGSERGAIPTFDQDMLYPFRTGTGKQYADCALRTGTVIKLYDYNVGAKHSGFRGAREALNENLVETILPFRILDFRWKPDPARGGDRAEGIDARPFYGMEFLLLRQHKEELRDEEDEASPTPAGNVAEGEAVHVGDFSSPEVGKVSVYAIPLRAADQQPEWLRKTNNKVFHAVNGQVQFKQTRGFLSTTCKLPALKDRLVVIVDASAMTFGAHNEIWKGDREHVRETTLGQRYKELVAETIRDSKVLKELQHKIAQQELKKATEVQSNALFQKLVTADPSLAALLGNREPLIRMPSTGGGAGGDFGVEEFTGRYSPTFLRTEERKGDSVLEIPLNRTRPLACRTDAENGYLRRTENRGRVVLKDDKLRSAFSVREHLHDGRLTLFLEPLSEVVEVGREFELTVALVDDAMAEPVVADPVTIRIVAEEADAKKRKPKAKNGAGGAEGGKGTGTGPEAPNVGLPACILLREHGEEVKGYAVERWPEGFSQSEGGLIEDLGEGEIVYKINYDNAYHLKSRLSRRGQVERDVVTEKYILGMRVLLLGMEQAFRAVRRAAGDRGQDLEEFAEDIRRLAARGAASTVLTLAEHLPTIVDKSAVTEEDE